MKKVTKVLMAIVTLATLALQNSTVQQIIASFLSSHPRISSLVAGVAVAAALNHNPQASS